jgi:hypothetical protein
LKITTGRVYLFEERVPLRTHQILRKELTEGREALYISKHSPNQLRSQFDFDPKLLRTLWLSPRPEQSCIPPMNLEIFEERVNEFLSENVNGIIVLNGVDVLEMWNGFRPVLEAIRRAKTRVNSNGTNLIISLDPKDFYHSDLSELEKSSDLVVSSYAESPAL